VGKGYLKVNIVQILCTHLYKWKRRPVETIPGMGGDGIKRMMEEVIQVLYI
jgi:hypothetical protein